MIMLERSIKEVLRSKVILVFSVIMVLILGLPYSANGVVIGKILTIGTCMVALFLGGKHKNKERPIIEIRRCEVIISLLTLAFLGIYFYQKYRGISIWGNLSGRLHCSENLIMMGTILFLLVGAFPAVLLFCQWVLIGSKDADKSVVRDENKFLKIIRLLVLIEIGCIVYFCFSKYLWVDESFSLSLIDHDYKTLWTLAAKDVHPPFYYIVLKFVVDLGYRFFPLSYARIYFAKVVSAIPLIALVFISETYIRKRYGKYVSVFFEVLILGMPNFAGYGVEIRMYSMALLFVTICFLAYLELLEKENKTYWFVFAASGILAAYTHYYACIAVALLYILLFLHVIKRKKNIFMWVVTALITIICYLPWLGALFGQLAKVSSGYWIEPIGFTSIWMYIIFWFGYYSVFPIVLGVVTNYWKNRKRYDVRERHIIDVGLILPVWVIGIGMAVSFLVRPVFVSRYMFAALGVFWFAVLIINRKNKGTMSYVCINLFLILFSVINLSIFAISEIKDQKHGDEIYEVVQSMEKESALYSNSPVAALFISLIAGKEVYTTPVFSDYEDQIYLEHIKEVEDISEIQEAPIYCFWISESDHKDILFEEKLGEFKEEVDLTLYRYDPK